MSERDGFQPGVPCWVDTWQPDADAAMSFYTQLFGWEAEDTMPDGVEGTHYMCRVRGRDVAAVASRPEASPDVTAWTTYVWVDDVDATVAKATDAGGSILVEPFDALDGGRIAVIADPAGAAIGAWQPGAHKGAQLVNEPGAWAMSSLSSDDPEGAKRFYAQLFGWDTRSFDMGGAEITMFTVPDFVGGEPQQPVPRDVVAVMVPPDGEDGPPRWSVDFWVADIDAAVSNVSGSGGEVLTPPYELMGGGMRQAVVRDPQGAGLTLTQPPSGAK